MSENIPISINQAIQDFRSARQKAILREIIARFTGEKTELLSYDEVRQKLKAQAGPKKELKEIPIDAIIGSVNRYQDFSRDFLPGSNIDEERWVNVELANYSLAGLPPIEAYQISEAYFVSDGNHRVSVARQFGSTHIQGYVTEVHSRVPLTADDRPEDLIIKSEYSDFLEHTNLDKARPQSELSVTVPGQYAVLEEHIAVHRYFMGLEQKRDISMDEAVADWYDTVYLPVVKIIREQGLLDDFPNRTEADLYLWIAEHRAALEEELNNQIEVEAAAADLAGTFSKRPYRIIARLGNKIVKALVPTILEAGPAAGEWRQLVSASQRAERLFADILVPINGQEDGWFALEQAFLVAWREEANIHSLYVVASEAEIDSQSTMEIHGEFTRRCERAGMQGELQIIAGDITQTIFEHAHRNDLLVLNLTYPPDASIFARLNSGIRNLVQKSPRPILFTPQVTTTMEHPLLAYDGSLKAQEALFIAAYIGGKWNVPLAVITVGDEENSREIQDDARRYLQAHNIQADYILENGNDPAGVILQHMDQRKIDLLIIGGYGRNPILEVVQGGEVDALLRQAHLPMLICR